VTIPFARSLLSKMSMHFWLVVRVNNSWTMVAIDGACDTGALLLKPLLSRKATQVSTCPDDLDTLQWNSLVFVSFSGLEPSACPFRRKDNQSLYDWGCPVPSSMLVPCLVQLGTAEVSRGT